MGIDPGVATTGYGIINLHDPQVGTPTYNLQPITYGVIRTSTKLLFVERLNEIHKELRKVIKKYKPAKIAIEEIFFAKNAKTALKVGQARGVAMLTAIQAKTPVVEFTPLQVKQAITGYGRASKMQIQKMVKILLNLKQIPKPDDAADALAIAICCANFKKYGL
jgi:crossover junction endodeoxyribonuclease RuvC